MKKENILKVTTIDLLEIIRVLEALRITIEAKIKKKDMYANKMDDKKSDKGSIDMRHSTAISTNNLSQLGGNLSTNQIPLIQLQGQEEASSIISESKKIVGIHSKRKSLLINASSGNILSLQEGMSPMHSSSKTMNDKRLMEKHFFVTHEFLNFNNLNNTATKDTMKADSKLNS